LLAWFAFHPSLLFGVGQGDWCDVVWYRFTTIHFCPVPVSDCHRPRHCAPEGRFKRLCMTEPSLMRRATRRLGFYTADRRDRPHIADLGPGGLHPVGVNVFDVYFGQNMCTAAQIEAQIDQTSASFGPGAPFALLARGWDPATLIAFTASLSVQTGPVERIGAPATGQRTVLRMINTLFTDQSEQYCPFLGPRPQGRLLGCSVLETKRWRRSTARMTLTFSANSTSSSPSSLGLVTTLAESDRQR